MRSCVPALPGRGPSTTADGLVDVEEPGGALGEHLRRRRAAPAGLSLASRPVAQHPPIEAASPQPRGGRRWLGARRLLGRAAGGGAASWAQRQHGPASHADRRSRALGDGVRPDLLQVIAARPLHVGGVGASACARTAPRSAPRCAEATASCRSGSTPPSVAGPAAWVSRCPSTAASPDRGSCQTSPGQSMVYPTWRPGTAPSCVTARRARFFCHIRSGAPRSEFTEPGRMGQSPRHRRVPRQSAHHRQASSASDFARRGVGRVTSGICPATPPRCLRSQRRRRSGHVWA